MRRGMMFFLSILLVLLVVFFLSSADGAATVNRFKRLKGSAPQLLNDIPWGSTPSQLKRRIPNYITGHWVSESLECLVIGDGISRSGNIEFYFSDKEELYQVVSIWVRDDIDLRYFFLSEYSEYKDPNSVLTGKVGNVKYEFSWIEDGSAKIAKMFSDTFLCYMPWESADNKELDAMFKKYRYSPGQIEIQSIHSKFEHKDGLYIEHLYIGNSNEYGDGEMRTSYTFIALAPHD